MTLERPWISLTLLEEARDKRNTVFGVKSLSEAADKGSYGAFFRLFKTTVRSHRGALTETGGQVAWKDRMSMEISGDSEISWSFSLKTWERADR